MNRVKRILGGLLLIYIAGGMLVTSQASAQENTKPFNVLFILADDFGYMDVGAYNPDTFYETPNLDELAASGTRFTAGYVANPVCSPTRFSIMTGKYPSRHDATDWFCGGRTGRFNHGPLNCYMPVEEFTMAEAFREGGYKTYFAGKWHLGPDPKHWPENQGFDVNKGGWRAGSPSAHGGGGFFSPYNNPRLEDGPEGEYLPYRLAEETKHFIEQNKDDPFFAYLSFYEVHNPRQAPAELIEKYEAKRERLGLDEADKFETMEQVWPNAGPRRVRVVQSHPVYAAMIEAMDTAIGRVLKQLEESGVADRTLVVFISDNGGLSTSEGHNTSNQPLRGGKGWVYEGGIREPLMIRWPGVTKPGSLCHEPVISTDFYPTLLEAAGLDPRPEQHLDGVSLVSLLKGTDLKPRPLFWHYPHYSNQGGFPGGAIRMGPWKLIERYEDGRVHLYHVGNDIGETEDLAEEHPERVAAMRKRLHQWYQEVDAKFLRQKEGGPEPWRPGEAN